MNAADGRRARGERTRASVMEGCRRLMCAGVFRPTVVEVARQARCSVRSVFQHYDDVESVHRAALDVATREAIARLIAQQLTPHDTDRVALAAVFGRSEHGAT